MLGIEFICPCDQVFCLELAVRGLMYRAHALGDHIAHFRPLVIQQAAVAFPDCGHQAVQFGDFFVTEPTLHSDDQPNLVQRVVGSRFAGEVIQFVAQVLFHLSRRIKHLHLVFEEALHSWRSSLLSNS